MTHRQSPEDFSEKLSFDELIDKSARSENIPTQFDSELLSGRQLQETVSEQPERCRQQHVLCRLLSNYFL